VILFLFCVVNCKIDYGINLPVSLPPGLEHFLPDYTRGTAKHSQRAVGEEIRQSDGPLRPLVIVPSFIGNQLEVKLESYSPQHFWCFRNEDWFTIWVDDREILPIVEECAMEYISLNYDPETKYVISPPGISMRPSDYGGIDGIAYIDIQKQTPIWNGIITLLQSLGYTIGTNLRSAPYDWRFGPKQWINSSFPQLKALIEETYYMNDNTSVAVTSLSMGGGHLLLFLNSMSQVWKDKYIHSFIPISSCFAGSMWAPTSLLGVPEFDFIHDYIVNWASISWLVPYLQIEGDRLLYTTPTTEYRTTDIPPLFRKLGLNTTADLIESMAIYQKLDPPGVPTYCIFGTDVETLYRIDFQTENFFSGPSVNTTTSGDGTCAVESLDMCSHWANQQPQPCKSIPISGMIHANAVFEPTVYRTLLSILGI
jgi:hypothetical protein